MTATIIKKPSSIKASKKRISPSHRLVGPHTKQHQQHNLTRTLSLTLQSTPDTHTSSNAAVTMLPLMSSQSVVGENCSGIKRNNTSILESLRRRYVHRGLGQTIVPSTCKRSMPLSSFPKDRDGVGESTWNDVSTQLPICIESDSVAMSSSTRVSLFETEDCACITSPLRIKSARRSVAPLKFDHSKLETDISDESDDDDDTISLNSNFSYVSEMKTNIPSKRQCIRFDSYVKVVEIPNRNTYTPKQRRRMWNGCDVIRKNAKRNRREYEYEGGKWNSVVEEDKFCLVDGRMVHPVHIAPCA